MLVEESIAAIRVLLRAGADAGRANANGRTPLHLAAGSHDLAAGIAALIRTGADPNRKDRDGATPLHAALDNRGWPGVVGTLLDGGTDPKRLNAAGLTALQLFVRTGPDQGDTAAMLIDAGADPDRAYPNGDAPLHVTIRSGGSRGKIEVAEALLAGGADPCVRDARRYTPYNIAREGGAIHRALDRAGGHDLACDGKEEQRIAGSDGTERDRAGAALQEQEKADRDRVVEWSLRCVNLRSRRLWRSTPLRDFDLHDDREAREFLAVVEKQGGPVDAAREFLEDCVSVSVQVERSGRPCRELWNKNLKRRYQPINILYDPSRFLGPGGKLTDEKHRSAVEDFAQICGPAYATVLKGQRLEPYTGHQDGEPRTPQQQRAPEEDAAPVPPEECKWWNVYTSFGGTAGATAEAALQDARDYCRGNPGVDCSEIGEPECVDPRQGCSNWMVRAVHKPTAKGLQEGWNPAGWWAEHFSSDKSRAVADARRECANSDAPRGMFTCTVTEPVCDE